jgi:hypothetical protein
MPSPVTQINTVIGASRHSIDPEAPPPRTTGKNLPPKTPAQPSQKTQIQFKT